jgi:hypothetical protein
VRIAAVIVVLLMANIVCSAQNQGVEGGEVEANLNYHDSQSLVRLESEYLYFGHVPKDTFLVKSIRLHNESKMRLYVDSESIGAPDFIKLSFDSLLLDLQGVNEILVSLDPSEAKALGYSEWQVSFDVLDSVSRHTVELFVVANIYPRYETNEGAPRISFDKSMANLGVVSQGAISQTSFEVTNSGLKPLVITDVKSNCGCVSWELPYNLIEPGKTQSLIVRFDTKQRKGHQYKNLTIFSNDPSAPIQVLNVKAQVVD